MAVGGRNRLVTPYFSMFSISFGNCTPFITILVAPSAMSDRATTPAAWVIGAAHRCTGGFFGGMCASMAATIVSKT